MNLNLPILDLLADRQSILLAGAGGGFDVFAGLPIYFALRALGKTVHLANYSFSELRLVSIVSETETLIDDLLVGAKGNVTHNLPYMPEAFLSQWFAETRGEKITVWMLDNVGAKPLTRAYRALCDHLKVDALVLVDGGVDSLMRGDEDGAGTLLEDTITLAATSTLDDVPVKILACIGFGTEVEEAVYHYNALENMAALAKAGAFLGSCALTPQMDAFRSYTEACEYVWSKPEHHKSHISTRIIPAVRGEFGGDGHGALLSPLMGLYWFFDAHTVMRHNYLMDSLANTLTVDQAWRTAAMRDRGRRPRRSLPY